MLIGVGERRGGVYYLCGAESVQASHVAGGTGELWHKRMGHPSSRVIQLLSVGQNKVAVRSDFNKSCDICARAKQTREIFNPSLNRALRIFELIHCDVWG
ncbi:unnamed protein product, partial [Cuscuta epithymum]